MNETFIERYTNCITVIAFFNSVCAGDPVYNLLHVCEKIVIVDSSPTLSRHPLNALFITILGKSVDGRYASPQLIHLHSWSKLLDYRFLNKAGKFCDPRVFSLFLHFPIKELARGLGEDETLTSISISNTASTHTWNAILKLIRCIYLLSWEKPVKHW